MDNAFKWLKENGGIMLEADYRYTGRGGTCKFDKTKAKVQVDSWVDIKAGDEVTMVDSLYRTFKKSEFFLLFFVFTCITTDLWLLLLTLTHYNSKEEESMTLLIARKIQTTELWPSLMELKEEKISGKSKTHGDLPGEKEVISESLEERTCVDWPKPSAQLQSNDFI